MQRRLRSSRLARTSEKQNKKQALFFTIGIIVLIGVLFQFGPGLINIFGNAIYTIRGGDKSDGNQLVGKELLQPPTLSGIPDATQSARINFSGYAPDKNGTVEVYVNDELAKEVEVQDKLEFPVQNIPLTKGPNTIKARFNKGDKTSAFTPDFQVNYQSDKPKLEVSFPVDNATLSRADKTITVTGQTDPDNTVSINSFRAIVENGGKFSYQLTLNDGDNQITIEAQNPAGLTTQKQLKVTYNP